MRRLTTLAYGWDEINAKMDRIAAKVKIALRGRADVVTFSLGDEYDNAAVKIAGLKVPKAFIEVRSDNHSRLVYNLVYYIGASAKIGKGRDTPEKAVEDIDAAGLYLDSPQPRLKTLITGPVR